MSSLVIRYEKDVALLPTPWNVLWPNSNAKLLSNVMNLEKALRYFVKWFGEGSKLLCGI